MLGGRTFQYSLLIVTLAPITLAVALETSRLPISIDGRGRWMDNVFIEPSGQLMMCLNIL
jgi:hypothetical protein